MKVEYAVVYERAPGNYSGYVPDLPGCTSAGDDLDEMRQMLRQGIAVFIEALIDEDEAVPPASMSVVDAMAFHAAMLAEPGEAVGDITLTEAIETTFGMLEVDLDQELAIILEKHAVA